MLRHQGSDVMRGSIEVHRYLTERGISHEFYRLDRPLRRLEEAAALLDLRADRVVSAVLFEARRTPVLVLVPAGMVASAQAVAEAAGESRVRPAKPNRVIELTGFLPSWLPPVGHERTTRALVDRTLAGKGALYAPGGDSGVMLVIRAADLIRATAGTVADLAAAEPDASPTDPVTAPGSSLLAG